jgi:hypothetical protein
LLLNCWNCITCTLNTTNDIQSFPAQDLIIYTDGSGHNGRIGAAIYSPTTSVTKGEYLGTDDTQRNLQQSKWPSHYLKRRPTSIQTPTSSRTINLQSRQSTHPCANPDSISSRRSSIQLTESTKLSPPAPSTSNGYRDTRTSREMNGRTKQQKQQPHHVPPLPPQE